MCAWLKSWRFFKKKLVFLFVYSSILSIRGLYEIILHDKSQVG